MCYAKHWLLSLTLVLAWVGLGMTCTVAPKPITSSAVSYDGTEANSGLVSYDAKTGLGVITPAARTRYNQFVARYGYRFVPALEKDQGLTAQTGGSNWVITAEALQNFATLTGWFRIDNQ